MGPLDVVGLAFVGRLMGSALLDVLGSRKEGGSSIEDLAWVRAQLLSWIAS